MSARESIGEFITLKRPVPYLGNKLINKYEIKQGGNQQRVALPWCVSIRDAAFLAVSFSAIGYCVANEVLDDAVAGGTEKVAYVAGTGANTALAVPSGIGQGLDKADVDVCSVPGMDRACASVDGFKNPD